MVDGAPRSPHGFRRPSPTSAVAEDDFISADLQGQVRHPTFSARKEIPVSNRRSRQVCPKPSSKLVTATRNLLFLVMVIALSWVVILPMISIFLGVLLHDRLKRIFT